MKSAGLWTAALAVGCTLGLGVVDAHAFRMIQNTSVIRTSTGYRVTCDDPGGFAHRAGSSVNWVINPAGQGGKAGVLTAFQNSLNSWNAVTTAGYRLSLAGTSNAGFATDGLNTALWSTGNGCTGGCLAITALVLGAGQVIQEADISFNDAVSWSTTGGAYDVQAIATHELGHSMGIHHTEQTSKHNRPTMYASYFGTDGRTLEADDRAALTCAHDRYPTQAMVTEPVLSTGGEPGPRVMPSSGTRLVSRSGPGVATLRFTLEEAGLVRLELFDIAGRHLITLVDQVRGAGEYELAWNGNIDAGRARSGMYFARVVTNRGEGHASVLLEE